MTDFDLSYYLISASFIVALNLVVFTSFRASYSNNKKAYLALASWALVVEALRQLPDNFLVLYPDSNILYVVSALIQFVASLTFLFALNLIDGECSNRNKAQASGFIMVFVVCITAQLLSGLPATALMWYVAGAPVIAVSMAIVWKILRVTPKGSASRNLLILSSFSILIARIWMPAIESLGFLDLIYYMEVLLFPIMLLALNLDEVEKTYRKVSALLDQKTQSEEDLQFILDNSLDVTLIADNVGLLLSWNQRAEDMIGYKKAQVLGKTHIDELFFDNYWHKNATGFSDFDSIIENAEGITFPVKVRMKTVHKEEQTYSIYVISQLATEKT
ncbi:MAG: PAS domain S-box-containing protein [Pseudohongiellaceae bacterium]|jgi:PAS domain S-box-containing protein